MPHRKIVKGYLKPAPIKPASKPAKTAKPAATETPAVKVLTTKLTSASVAAKVKLATVDKSEKPNNGGYSAESITVLEGLEAVRRRPGMYIGSTGPVGLHHLIWEVVDNSIDEAMAGYAKNITVKLLPDHKVEVRDDGRGIPVDIHPQKKISALEIVMTVLHAGGKFGGDSTGYKISGGLHGVGASVVNALSSYTKAEVHRDGKIWIQEYEFGKPLKKVREAGTAKDTGTITTFRPDSSIFESVNFEWKTIIDHLRQHSYLTKGIHLTIIDERPPAEKEADKTALPLPNPAYQFYFEGGVASYVRYLNQNKELKNENIFYVDKEAEGVNVEIALQYTGEFTEALFAFTNNIFNTDGGTHVAGFRTALTRSINTYARNKGFLKEKDQNLGGEDVREGLTAVISVKIREPQFEGQTKGKLGNTEAKTAVESVLGDAFLVFLEEHPRDAEGIIGKCVLAAKARAAAKIARDTILRKGALEGFTLPGKLADCSSRKAEESELYIVEGDSAGGCWHGKTKVALADGRNISFEELVEEDKQGKKNFCYTIMENGHIGLAPIINPRMTKRNAEVIKVILDTGEELVCTPDHLFRLVDGSYIPACELTSKHSIAPLYKKLSKRGEDRRQLDGYEMIFDPKEKRWIYTHLLADFFNLRNNIYIASAGKYRHHVDFNKLNNNPTNIKRVTHDQHMAIHYANLERTLHRPDSKLKSILTKQTKEFREKARGKSLEKRELFSKNAKKQWQNEEYKKFMINKFLEFYFSNESYRRKNNALLNELQKQYWSDEINRNKQAERVAQFFTEHPERKEWLRAIAVKEWSDKKLIQWRTEKTKEQWTDEFRARRRQAYNRTYLYHSLGFAKKILEVGKDLFTSYDTLRQGLPKRNNNIVKLETLLNRFFSGDKQQLLEATVNFNHKIKHLEKINERFDVYDLEVSGTHNFALASGIFVHNSAKQGRDREHQAILPLRGKVLNVERARLDKILTNNELKSLIIAMGTNIGEQFDIAKLRYHRIVIMTDADVDGAHIRTLLLTFFYRYYPDLIRQAHIYIAQPPLYSIKYGKEMFYAYNDEEKAKVLAELEKNKKAKTEKSEQKKKTAAASEGAADAPAEEPAEEGVESIVIGGIKVLLQRYKGLGEMNPEQLWETTMNPAKRIMKVVTAEDAELANETFEILMGDEVEPRKKFIQTHAKQVQNLDI